jgi:glycolate oxidase
VLGLTLVLPTGETVKTGGRLAYFDTLKQAGVAISNLLAAGVIPATLEFLDRRCMDAVEES